MTWKRWGGPTFMFAVCALNIARGSILLLTRDADNTAVTGGMIQLIGSGFVLGLMWIAAAVMTLWAIRRCNIFTCALLCVPQLTLQVMVGTSALIYALSGHYADGTVRPISFILLDQLPSVVLGFGYIVSVVRFMRWR